MEATFDLLERPTYAMRDVDRLLRLSRGTAQRWIDGYTRGRRAYEPVVRLEATGSDVVTWGDFVETRLLAEYRLSGAAMANMRRSVVRLREELQIKYPLALARTWVRQEGRELVRAAQSDADVDATYQLVVVRNDQLVLAHQVSRFVESVDFSPTTRGDAVVERIFPEPDLRGVTFDPTRKSGFPVITGRGIPTEVIAEQVRAGDSLASIAGSYDLSPGEVESAVRYELIAAAHPRLRNERAPAA